MATTNVLLEEVPQTDIVFPGLLEEARTPAPAADKVGAAATTRVCLAPLVLVTIGAALGLIGAVVGTLHLWGPIVGGDAVIVLALLPHWFALVVISAGYFAAILLADANSPT
jgi:hypothetical protein